MAEKKFNVSEVQAPKKMKAMFMIVERTKVDFYLAGIESFGVNFQSVVFARGTASQKLLQMAGGVDSSKALIVSLVSDDLVKPVLEAVEDRYFKTKNGKGVVFTVSLDSMIGLHLYEILSNMNEEVY